MRAKTSKNKTVRGLVLTFSIYTISLSGCANPGNAGDDAVLADDPETPFVGTDADVQVRGRSRVLLDFKWSERLRDVKGTVIGTAPMPSLTPLLDQPGRFQFAPLKTGIYDFVIEATRLAEEPSQASQPLALRISGIEMKSEGDIFLRDIELRPYLELSGEVRVLGTGPQLGAEVSIPGTTLKALTDENGHFKLSKVPQGYHLIQVKYANLTPAIFEKRQFTASQDLPSLTIFNDSRILPVGVHYVGDPIPAQSEALVTLFLQRPQNMNMLRWGFSQDLSAAAWVPYQSSLDFKLGAAQRQIFVQYSLDQKQLSPVYPLQFP